MTRTKSSSVALALLCFGGTGVVGQSTSAQTVCTPASSSVAGVGELARLGTSSAIDGSVAVIGAMGDNDNGAVAGAAYVLRYDPGTSSWVEEQKLLASNGTASDFFGSSVAVLGDVIVVGASAYDIGADTGDNRGAAYVFRFDPITSMWAEEVMLSASDGATGDHLGSAVAMSGDRIVVGASHGVEMGVSSGTAYVYHHDGMNWVEEQKLFPPDGEILDLYGTSLDMEGDTILIGSYLNNENGFNSGAAYVYRHDGAAWVQTQKFMADDGTASDQFGFDVALSGSRAVIGATRTANPVPDSGAAYIFEFDGATWNQGDTLSTTICPTPSFFGSRVDVDGDRIVVTAYSIPDPSYPGHAVLFVHDGATWVEDMRWAPAPDSGGGVVGNAFGSAMCLDGETVIFGDQFADGDESDSGLFYVATLSECPSSCAADIDDDGMVGVTDFLAVLISWGPCDPPCAIDEDRDCLIGIIEFLSVLAKWGPCD